MILHETRQPAGDSHEISCLICYFGKSGKILNCGLLQIIGVALRVLSATAVVIAQALNSFLNQNVCCGYSKEPSQ